MPVGVSCLVRVRFNPSDPGPRTSNLVIDHSGDNTPLTYTLRGVAPGGPRFVISASAFDFERVATIPYDAATHTYRGDHLKEFLIGNQGDRVLTGTITQPAAPFGLPDLGGASQSFSVGAGGSLRVRILFKPIDPDVYTGAVVIATNDPDAARVEVSLRGELYWGDESPTQGKFGKFFYRDTPGRVEIEIDPDWIEDNLVPVAIPGFGTARCHRLALPNFTQAFNLIVSNRLQGLIHKFDGLWVPRYQRDKLGRRIDKLSNHSWGTAIDLNYDYPKGFNTQGSRAKASPANKTLWKRAFSRAGFKWGNGFAGSRKDPPHYEVK